MTAAYPCLVADVGGTNARFAWLEARGAPVSHVAILPVQDHAGPAAAARSYLARLRLQLGEAMAAPRAMALAVATAVAGDRVELTNGHWSFSRAQLQAELGLATLLVLNDFEALALSLPRLQAAQRRFWPGLEAAATLSPGSAMAVIGPGTGLGVAGVLRLPQAWVALAGEGGHATLAAANAFESELLAYVRRDFAHVSAERLLSGIGLPVLHGAVAAVRGQSATELLTAAQIVERGLTGRCEICLQTLDAFCALLGGFAGNVALTLGARAGVYIGGGIVPRLGERFFASEFRARFEAKGRFESYLQAIPTALITDTLAALSGAAMALEQHEL